MANGTVNGAVPASAAAPARVEASTGWYNDPVYPGEGLYGYGTVADLFARAPDRGNRDINIGAVPRRASLPKLEAEWRWNPDPPEPLESDKDSFPIQRRFRHGRTRAQIDPDIARIQSTQHFGVVRQPDEGGFWTRDGVRVDVDPTPEEQRGSSGPIWAVSGGGLITGFQDGGEVSAASEGDSKGVGLWDYGEVSGVSGVSGGDGGRDGLSGRASLPQLAVNWKWHAKPRGPVENLRPSHRGRRRSGPGGQGSGSPPDFRDSDPAPIDPAIARNKSTQHFGDVFNPGVEGFWTRDGVRVDVGPSPEEQRGSSGPIWAIKGGGLVRRGFQDGGLASLLQEREALMEAPEIPVGPGISEEIVTGNGQEEKIAVFSEAKMALEGGHPNPNPVLERFVELFGIDALEKLRDIIRSGGGDGMSDSIPGRIDGEEEVALSEGEYVIPADAVSGMGNGSTEAGAEALRRMVDEVRVARTGTPEQAPAIDPRMLGLGAAPSMMARGGMVRGYQAGGPVGPLNLPTGGSTGPMPHRFPTSSDAFSGPVRTGLPHRFPISGGSTGLGLPHRFPTSGGSTGLPTSGSMPLYPGYEDARSDAFSGPVRTGLPLYPGYEDARGAQLQSSPPPLVPQNMGGFASPAPVFGWGNQQADQNRVPGWRTQTFG